MSTSLLYHTQCVVGFQHECFEFSEGKVIQHIKRQKIKCPCCRHESISAYPLRERMVQSLPYRNKPTFLKFTVHRIYCPRCGKEYVERFHFLSHPESRQTTALERTIVELRRDMSIHAISQYYHIPWSTVKNIEKRYLQTKFKTIPLKKVKVIGIDEIAIGRKKGKPVYWTIVRDLVPVGQRESARCRNRFRSFPCDQAYERQGRHWYSYFCCANSKIVPMSAFSTLSHWFISIISRFSCQKPSKNLFFEGHLFIRLILVQLMADVFLDCLFFGPHRTHEVPPTPEVTVSIFVLQVRMTVEYHQITFSLQIPHELRHAQIRWDTHQHVDVIRTCVRFQNLHFLLLAQRPEDFPDAHFDLTVHSLSTKFRRKYDMVLAIPFLGYFGL